ncbi:meiosis 1 arrest protein isoform 6-T8 [Syngnathus typhle]
MFNQYKHFLLVFPGDMDCKKASGLSNTAFLRQPARVLIVDAVPPRWSDTRAVLCDALENFLTMVCSLKGPSRLPFLSVFAIGGQQQCLLPFAKVRGNLPRLLSCVAALRAIPGKGVNTELASVGEHLRKTVLDSHRQFHQYRKFSGVHVQANISVEVTVVTSRPGTGVVSLLKNVLKDDDLEPINSFLVVQLDSEVDWGQDEVLPQDPRQICSAGLCAQAACVKACCTGCRSSSPRPPAGGSTGTRWRVTDTPFKLSTARCRTMTRFCCCRRGRATEAAQELYMPGIHSKPLQEPPPEAMRLIRGCLSQINEAAVLSPCCLSSNLYQYLRSIPVTELHRPSGESNAHAAIQTYQRQPAGGVEVGGQPRQALQLSVRSDEVASAVASSSPTSPEHSRPGPPRTSPVFPPRRRPALTLTRDGSRGRDGAPLTGKH